MTLQLPSHETVSTPRRTLGWLASASATALMVSGIAALAMAVPETDADSIGDAEPVMIMLAPPTPAVEAISEPSPDVSQDAPEQVETAPPTDDAPDTPELTEAPDVPEEAPVVEEVMADALPEPDLDIPELKEPEITPPEADPTFALARPKPRPERVEEEQPKPEKKVAEEKPREKKRKKREEKPREEAEKKPASKASTASAPSQAAAGATSAGAGQKAAASYEGQVMKKVRRTRKKNAGARGTAVVSFSISGGGGLGSVQIVRSSGSAQLDQVALDHIRRSAPFPAPPPGAPTRFSFAFEGR